MYIDGEIAPTAHVLMRSRYTAYFYANEKYLLDTWHPSTRPEKLNLYEDEKRVVWFDLKIRNIDKGGAKDNDGTVEFTARFKQNGKAQHLHEVSQFSKVNGRWYYVGGVVS